MRIRVIALLITVAITTNSISPSFSAIKSGSKCKKIGVIKIEKKSEFKCVKSKNGLVWKRIDAQSRNQSAGKSGSESNQSSQSQTATEKKSSPNDQIFIGHNIIYQLNNGMLERKSNSGDYFAVDSREQSDINPVRLRAFKALNEMKRTTGHPNVEFIWDVRPSYPKEIVDYSIKRAAKAAEIFNYVFDKKITVHGMLATEKDAQYGPITRGFYGNAADLFRQVGVIDKKFQLLWIGGGGGYWEAEGQISGRFFLATPSSAKPEDYSSDWIQVSVHEFFHVVQQYIWFGRTRDDYPDYSLKIPSHLREGAANLVGYALSSENVGWYSDAMDVGLFRVWESKKDWKSAKSEADIVEILIACENREDPIAFDAAYPVGSIFYEWMIGEYGLDKFLELLTKAADGPSYTDTTKAVFGMSKEQLYAKAAPYILDIFKKHINK